MKVENIILDGDLGVVRAARVSFDKTSEEFTPEDIPLIKYLAKHKHETPFRHSYICFSVPEDASPIVGDVYLTPFEKAGLHIEKVGESVVYRNTLLGWLNLIKSGAIDVCYNIIDALYKVAPTAVTAYLGDMPENSGYVLAPVVANSKWLDTISLRCEAPIFIARQLGKHQADLSWNECSRRYVDDRFEFHSPAGTWRKRPDEGIKQGSGEDIEQVLGYEAEVLYRGALDHSNLIYENLVTCKRIAPEMARMVLPQSMLTKWVWSGSIAAFAHVWSLRSKPNAQKEVQEFADKMKKAILEVYPEYAELFE